MIIRVWGQFNDSPPVECIRIVDDAPSSDTGRRLAADLRTWADIMETEASFADIAARWTAE